MIHSLGATLKVGCNGPDCYIQDPHYHQHWIYWPDLDDDTTHSNMTGR